MSTKPEPQKHRTSHALFACAGLFLIPLLLKWTVDPIALTPAAWRWITGSLIFLAGGLAARWKPVPPALVCLIAYVTVMAIVIRNGALVGNISWILHGTILILLIVGLVTAVRDQKKRKAAPPSGESQ